MALAHDGAARELPPDIAAALEEGANVVSNAGQSPLTMDGPAVKMMRIMRLVTFATSMATLALWATAARGADAGGTTASPATAAVSYPDIVRLKDGGMMRGTILELVPNSTVTIQLADGRTRTIPISDTTYAGPASGDGRASGEPSSEPLPYATVHAEQAKLSLAGSEPNLTFYLQTSSAAVVSRWGWGAWAPVGARARGFSRLCTAPCGVDVPAGTQRFALSRPDGNVVVADEDVVVRGNETIHGGIVDRHGTRVAGILLLSIGTPLGAGAIALGAVLSSNPQSKAPAPLYVGGTVAMIASIGVGVALVTRKDYVTLDVQPVVAALAPALGVSAPRLEGIVDTRGLTATLRF